MRVVVKYTVALVSTVMLAAAGSGGAEARGCYSKCAPKRCYHSCRPKPVAEPVCYKCFKRVVTPPTYRKVPETVLVHPERTYVEIIPAKFTYEKEKILISEGKTEWVKKHGLLCEVTIPPKYKYEIKKVQTSAEQRIPHTIPAVYTTIYKTEQASPGSESWVPAKSGCGHFGHCGHGGHGRHGGYGQPGGYGAATPPPGVVTPVR